jgi:hypothetical protein
MADHHPTNDELSRELSMVKDRLAALERFAWTNQLSPGLSSSRNQPDDTMSFARLSPRLPSPSPVTSDARIASAREFVFAAAGRVYGADRAALWMSLPYKDFDGRTADQMVAAGEADRVLAWLNAVELAADA